MLKEAIEKIVELAGVKVVCDNDGNVYTNDTVFQLRPDLDRPEHRHLTSLDALAKLVRTEAVHFADGTPLYITVPAYNKVECFTAIQPAQRNTRYVLYTSEAVDVPGWNPETRLPFEQASIALQTRFQPTTDRDYALRLLSQITTGGKVTYNDNGIATSIITQKGVALQGTEAIKPLVKLKPYRTFQEVDQPESLFLIRIDERGISFIEADGGMWKLDARATVKTFLETALHDLVEAGSVVIAL